MLLLGCIVRAVFHPLLRPSGFLRLSGPFTLRSLLLACNCDFAAALVLVWHFASDLSPQHPQPTLLPCPRATPLDSRFPAA